MQATCRDDRDRACESIRDVRNLRIEAAAGARHRRQAYAEKIIALLRFAADLLAADLLGCNDSDVNRLRRFIIF